MNQDRFCFFRAVHHESDLLIGVPPGSYLHEMKEVALKELVRLRLILLEYGRKDPRFLNSLEPLPLHRPGENPDEIITMLKCGKEAGTGPMAAVAGLFAERVGRKLADKYQTGEVVVENGGDLFLRNETDLVSVIHAGSSPLSDKMAFVVPPGEWGICTSSGTLGHSFSKGKADAVTIISNSAPLADAWATALANKVQGPGDIEPLLETVEEIPGIVGCAVIVGDRIGVRGSFQVKLLSSE
jgi:ApbE superfamily uncharacterized protein (UPF0280 family)